MTQNATRTTMKTAPIDLCIADLRRGLDAIGAVEASERREAKAARRVRHGLIAGQIVCLVGIAVLFQRSAKSSRRVDAEFLNLKLQVFHLMGRR